MKTTILFSYIVAAFFLVLNTQSLVAKQVPANQFFDSSRYKISGIKLPQLLPTSIGGKVFHDVNGNSFLNPITDYGLLGWKIILGGAANETTFTDSNGGYEFSGLSHGIYTVKEEQQSGWVRTMPEDPGTYTVTIISDSNVTGKDFGNWPQGIIRGTDFHDLNVNHQFDGGEPGLVHWIITMSGPISGIDTTDNNGNYAFFALIPGTYTIRESLALNPGWTQTMPDTGYYTVSLVVGSRDTLNFGNFLPSSIRGKKYLDKSADSAVAGDPTLNGWIIKLFRGGILQGRIITSGSGDYSFTNLGGGTYTVQESLAVGWIQTFPRIGSPGVVSPLPDPGAGARAYSIVLNPGVDTTGIDFANFRLGSISGRKFKDANKNGVEDPWELGLSGWKIKLSGPQKDSVITPAGGNYTFSGLQKGIYTITETPQVGWVETFPSLPGTYTISIDTSATTVTNKDFGNFQTRILSGVKFNDLNGNHAKDGGEGGISGWKIYLSGAIIDSTRTDVSGNYTFSNLDSGTYVVSESLRTDWLQTFPLGGTYTIHIDTTISVFSGNNFGNFKLVSISGQKFNDINGNSTKDPGDTGLSGWKIYLKGALSDSVLTDVNGNYAFSNLGPGSYTVSESLKTGWVQTHAPTLVTVTSGTNYPGRDFGNFQNASLTGHKFHDLNGDGVKNGADSTMRNWRIRLTGPKQDSILTDVNGNYLFTGLGPGTYTVSEKLQAGWSQTLPGGTGTYTITVTSGSLDTGSFGNLYFGGISGRKFQDVNGDGLQQLSEPGLEGWTIQLQRDTGTVYLYAATVTDSMGNYSFTHLPGGSYIVKEVSQPGWVQTVPPPPTPTYLVTLGSGQFVNGFDFGNFSLGIITGMKFNDRIGNGVKDLNDSAIAGWKIKLIKNGNDVDSTVTDSSGVYTFIGVFPGIYTVKEESRIGWIATYPDSTGSFPDSMIVGGFHNKKNFGNTKLGSIRGLKFEDVNGDSIKEVSESVLSGWRIRLNGLRVDSLVTDVNGNYAFTDLKPGTYFVSESLRSGWKQTLPSSGIDTIIITSGKDTAGVNFGNFEFASISGMKYLDNDKNGIFDGLDAKIPGWNIYLYGQNPLNNRVTTTDDSGSYSFVDIGPDVYTVSEEVRTGWASISPPTGQYLDTVHSGQKITGRDFGNFRDTSMFRTFSQSDYLTRSVNLKPTRRNPNPIPNAGNVRDNIERLDNDPNLFSAGIPRPDSAHKYAWVSYFSHPTFVRFQLFLPQTGPARGFVDWGGGPWTGRRTILVPKRHDNHLAGERFILKFNVVASDLGVTPRGLGDLIYYDSASAGNPCNGKAVRQIITLVDSALTFWRSHMSPLPDPLVYFKQLDSCVTRIDSAFLGPIDLYSITPLRLRGVRNLDSVYFLRPSLGPLHGSNISQEYPEHQIPKKYFLYQNYPNPFNPVTTIQFDLPEPAVVTIKVYNILGQEVAILLNSEQVDKGMQAVEFDASSLASGVYFYQLAAKGIGDGRSQIHGQTFMSVKKMLLMK